MGFPSQTMWGKLEKVSLEKGYPEVAFVLEKVQRVIHMPSVRKFARHGRRFIAHYDSQFPHVKKNFRYCNWGEDWGEHGCCVGGLERKMDEWFLSQPNQRQKCYFFFQ